MESEEGHEAHLELFLNWLIYHKVIILSNQHLFLRLYIYMIDKKEKAKEDHYQPHWWILTPMDHVAGSKYIDYNGRRS